MLGAHLLLDLTRQGIQVRALKRKNSDLTTVKKIFSWYSADHEQLFGQIEWIEGDITDKDSLREGMKGAEAVIHAAAKVSFNPHDRDLLLHENVEGTANLVDLALELQVPRFCHVSSIAALGDQEWGVPVNEDFHWKNDRRRSAYAEGKFLSEMEVWRGVQEGLSCVIINPAIILGPGRWASGSPSLFQTVWNGLHFYTNGSNGFVDVRDVSRAAIALVLAKDWEAVQNQRYVLSAGNHTYREIFDWIAEALHRPKATIRAGRFLLCLGCTIAKLKSLLTGAEPALTKETARSSTTRSVYDGSKIGKVINFSYTLIDTTIRDIGKIFREEKA